MTEIVVVGSGVVGSATGIGLAARGHNVTFVDISADRVKRLRAEGYAAQREVTLGSIPAFVFLTLPTPHAGRRYDLSALADGTAAVARAMAGSPAAHTVIVRSTVPPGTTQDLVRPILEGGSGLTAGQGFGLACNPEFLRAASAKEDFARPWMTVIASRDQATRARVGGLLAPFGGQTRFFDNPATAELIKCAHNLFNAAKISFWNEMWLVATGLGVNPDDISTTVALSAEGSFSPRYGIHGGAAYGGACLPKDTNGFLGFAADHDLSMPLLEAVVAVNERMAGLPGRPSAAVLPVQARAAAEPVAGLTG
jgi:UDPglucose 6-dehydrogenase